MTLLKCVTDQLAMAGKIDVFAALIGNHHSEAFKKFLNLLPKVESIKDVDRYLWYVFGREKLFHKASNISGTRRNNNWW